MKNIKDKSKSIEVCKGDYISYYNSNKDIEYLGEIKKDECENVYFLSLKGYKNDCINFNTVKELVNHYSQYEDFFIYKVYNDINEVLNKKNILYYAVHSSCTTLLNFCISKLEDKYIMHDEEDNMEDVYRVESTYDDLINRIIRYDYDFITLPIKMIIKKDNNKYLVIYEHTN